MMIPKQIAKQIAEVEELEKSLTSGAQDADQNVADSSDGSSDKIDDAPIDGAPIDGGPTVAAQAADIGVPVDEGADKPQQGDVQKQDDTDWRQKYLTLKGKYDAEVPRLHKQVAELQHQVSFLLENIKTLTETDRHADTKNSEPKKQLVTDADKEAFGAEMIDLQRRVAREEMDALNKAIEQLRAENEELRKVWTANNNKVASLSFEQKLLAAVPDFYKVDTDPKWIAWLDEVDPILRAPRRFAVQYAYDNGDVDGVVYYINMWRQSVAGDSANKQAELQRQAAPARSAGSAHVNNVKDAQRKIYTAAEIDKLWEKVRQLNIRGAYNDAAKLEAEITAAFHDGRVIG